MLENAPTNVMFADRDFVIRYMNPASLETLRKLEEQSVGAEDTQKAAGELSRMAADLQSLVARFKY